MALILGLSFNKCGLLRSSEFIGSIFYICLITSKAYDHGAFLLADSFSLFSINNCAVKSARDAAIPAGMNRPIPKKDDIEETKAGGVRETDKIFIIVSHFDFL